MACFPRAWSKAAKGLKVLVLTPGSQPLQHSVANQDAGAAGTCKEEGTVLSGATPALS